MITFYQTDPGKVRSHNEDSVTIVKNNNDEYGVIAGYPWFDQWGRDTFIAFEGLLLVTKRFDIAKNVLLSNIKSFKNRRKVFE